MGKLVTLDLDEGLIAGFERAAAEHGRTLEAELRAALAATTLPAAKDTAKLLALSDAALAMSLPDGPVSDGTLMIRWDRDTNHGKWIDDGWDHGVAGR